MKFKTILLLIFCFFALRLFYPRPLQSVPPANLKDILSNSQLSYFAHLGTGITVNNTILNVMLTSGSAPSITTNNLFVGDTIGIGNTNQGGILTTYTIRDIASTAQFEINTGIGSSQAFSGMAVIASRSAIHYVSFAPKTSIAGGAWQVLIKSTSSAAGNKYNDGIPDFDGFDSGQNIGSTITGIGTALKANDVTCPWSATASVGTTVARTTAGSTAYYNVIKCQLGAGVTNPVDGGTTATITIGSATIGSGYSGTQLINPAPASNHTEGSADTYIFYLEHLDSAGSTIPADTAQGKIAAVESVRVTATVDPTITFTIDNTGVSTGSTACGNTAFGSNAANTTATQVAFGSLTLGASNNLAQRLTCTTNATGGYVVTVYETATMKNINTGTTLVDTTCNSACTTSTAGAWTSTTNSGWGYTIQGLAGIGSTAFTFPNYKPFGVGYANTQTIFSNTSKPTANEQAYVCYRLVASTTQEAGNYETQITYTATATF